MELIRVAHTTNCSSCAGAISEQMKSHGSVAVQVIGAGALNQAVKAIVISKGHLAPLGLGDLVCRPSFVTLDIKGSEKTGIKIIVTNGAKEAG